MRRSAFILVHARSVRRFPCLLQQLRSSHHHHIHISSPFSSSSSSLLFNPLPVLLVPACPVHGRSRFSLFHRLGNGVLSATMQMGERPLGCYSGNSPMPSMRTGIHVVVSQPDRSTPIRSQTPSSSDRGASLVSAETRQARRVEASEMKRMGTIPFLHPSS
jgi:hypothetical protein